MVEAIEIVVTSRYGTLSRGHHSARKGTGGAVEWATKDAHGRLVITEPGVWLLHCSDGFKRSARAILTVDEEGGWKMSGEVNRFSVVD